MGKCNSVLARSGKVRYQTPKQKISKILKIVKKLQGRAGKRQKFCKFIKLSLLRKTQHQNQKSITRKGWQKRTKKTQMIQIFIKEFN